VSKQGDRWTHYDAATRAGWEYLSGAVLTLRGEPPGRESASVREDSASSRNEGGMQRYRSPDGTFALDIPTHWRTFPPVRSNSPIEVIRFASYRDGIHLLIIFRGRRGLGQTLEERCAHVQSILLDKGFRNFVSAETAIGPRAARTLDFDRPQGSATWSCREYFLTEGRVTYTLGFGTTNKVAMFDLYDRIAQSFEILEEDQAAA
jgi:hypothetical protein